MAINNTYLLNNHAKPDTIVWYFEYSLEKPRFKKKPVFLLKNNKEQSLRNQLNNHCKDLNNDDHHNSYKKATKKRSLKLSWKTIDVSISVWFSLSEEHKFLEFSNKHWIT